MVWGARMSDDVVAAWDVPLSDRVHRIEFEHGTTSGKRVVRLDGKELFRRDWMFKLVGSEEFDIGRVHCVIKVEPSGAFSYSYELEVDGKTYEKFTELQTKAMKTWMVDVGDETYRVVLERDTLDVWANGQKLEATGEFVDDGTETHFSLGGHPAYIKAVTSGKRREGIIHNLIVDDAVIPEMVD
ncbi:fas apoptotic inhibitory molecule 1 isoform X2 [Bacillus rossius redtenbacheri]|uniref:fas apoptotic inhibitory molecule 1 isoform X2 n=1 Tax=Bacillus rossius redtenbacheri TaxID=93214 RepID=UPI002FDDF914